MELDLFDILSEKEEGTRLYSPEWWNDLEIYDNFKTTYNG